ncbi:MAG: hypothetical protein GX629_01670 [Phycisphaerae bacterium]|jgi:uncharacterized membrane protein|nr:hypothetical protein [Phycisphaerae bacterium]
MWFKIISFILAASSFIKMGYGIAMGDRFFDWARREYKRERPSGLVTVLFLLTLLLTLITWYATWAHYVPYGWILTVLMTFFGLYALVILLKWKSITPKYIPLIGRFQKNRTFWYIIGVIWGVVFLLMGIFLY